MAGKVSFEKLFEPYHIGKVKTRNRIIKSAADMGFSDKEGYVSERHKRFYEALAKGGVGLIIVETTMIEPYAPGGPHTFLRICDDKNIPGLSELAGLIHKHGCPAFILLGGGEMLHFSDAPDDTKYPGGDPHPLVKAWLHDPKPPTISISEIRELIEKYAVAAERAKKAGFDGVEIHGASMSLYTTLLSRAWNKRDDEYGCQSMENRTRLLVEIIQAVKNRVGKDFPVSVLINAAEFGVEKGITSEESQQIALLLEAAGADAIQTRAWGYGEYSGERVHVPDQLFFPEPPSLPEELDGRNHGAGLLVPLAAAIKKVVNIPVIAVGRLDAKLGEQIVRKGQADFVVFNRRLLADPEYPNKIASGREDDIAPCTACMYCFGRVSLELPVQCRINAHLGSDQEYIVKPAQHKKKVLIFGGGPAGMEAARVAALRGHEVTLYEKGHKLGGLLPLAALVKGFEIEDLMALVRYLATQITKLGVKVKLGKEGNLTVIEQMKPDAVVLATGGIPTVPKIPGINRRNVLSGGDLHRKLKTYLRFFGPGFLRFLTKFWMPLGKRVVIIGGDIQGSELAEFLVKRGRKVTIVDTGKSLGMGMTEWHKVHLFDWMAKKGATMMTHVTYREIANEGLTLINGKDKKSTIKADTIVPALPLAPDAELLEKLKRKVPEVYAIGDCNEPRLIVDAIADGFRVANTI